MLRRSFSVVTIAGLLVALVVAIAWFAASPAGDRWEPAISALSLIAAFTGIFAERWAADAERRSRALGALLDEFTRNRDAFVTARVTQPAGTLTHPRVYPRLSAQATQDALRQGVFGLDRDESLQRSLYEWVSSCDELNHRLDLTEMLVFSSPSQARIQAFEATLHRPGGLLEQSAALNDRVLEAVRAHR